MSDLYKRMIVASILALVVICLIVFAFHPIFQFFVAGIVAIMAGVAVWEYEQFVKAKGGKMTTPVLIVLSMAEVIAFFLYANDNGLRSLPVAVFFGSFLILFAMHFREKEGAIVNLAVSSFGLFYIAVPIGMVLGILYADHVDGRWWIAYLLVITKITDVGAYFAGSLWGKHKLAPHISPKKTIEGAVAGLICAVVASFLFYVLSDFAGFRMNEYSWFFLGIILGVVGQFGDLSESLLKRDAQKKDSNVIPGIGGILDSIDSVIFNAIIIFVYLYYIHI